MKRGWYIYCPDCGATTFLAQWKWLAQFKWWLMSMEEPSDADALLRCGDNPVECELIWNAGGNHE